MNEGEYFIHCDSCSRCAYYPHYPTHTACQRCIVIGKRNNDIPSNFVDRYRTFSRDEIKPLASSRPDPTKMICMTDVKFNGPATIVFWSDGTKTVVKCSEGDTYDKEKGLAMAIIKKFIGNNNGSYYRKMKEWLED